MRYPDVLDASGVGTYPAETLAGGGFVWDAVLEYRVWCHPVPGAPNEAHGNDYFCALATYAKALAFSRATKGAEKPLALILQREYIDEPQPGQYVHVKKERIAEWRVEFLSRPKRTPQTIPDFFSAKAPSNRLDILRGL